MLKDSLQKERKRKEEDRMVERKENRVKKGRNEWGEKGSNEKLSSLFYIS